MKEKLETIKNFVKEHKKVTIIAGVAVLAVLIGGISFGVHQSNVAKEKAAIEAQKKEEAAKKAEAKKKAEEEAKKAEEARKAEEEAKKAEEEAAKKEAEVAEAEAKNTTKNTKNSKNTNKNTNSSNSSSQSSQAQTSSTQGATQPTGSASFVFCGECGQVITGDPKDHWPVCPVVQAEANALIAEGDYGCKIYNNGTSVITDEARDAYREQWEAEKDLYGGIDLDSYVHNRISWRHIE